MDETYRQIDQRIEAYEKTLREADEPESKAWQRNVEILSSMRDVGTVVLATLLVKSTRYSAAQGYNALRTDRECG